MTTYTTLPTPLGELLLVGTDAALTGVYLPGHRRGASVDAAWERDDRAFPDARAQLAAYFAGEPVTFDVVAAARGTAFQEAVWSLLAEIPYGETTTYGDLARRLGRPAASRPVGAAVARNPLSIILPCHRVVGAGARLTGYAGGLDAKRYLLALERGLALEPVGGAAPGGATTSAARAEWS